MHGMSKLESNDNLRFTEHPKGTLYIKATQYCNGRKYTFFIVFNPKPTGVYNL